LPGNIVRTAKDSFAVVATDGLVYIEELQMEGKKKMAAPEFLRGLNINELFHFEK
jgi:methionyl-tRNA formyltransferase